MIQEIIVYIIGIAVAVYVAWRIAVMFRRRGNPCSGCSGCDIQEELRRAAARKKECGKYEGREPSSQGPSCGCGK